MGVSFTSHKKEVMDAVTEAKKRALEVCGGTAERYAKENITVNKSVISGNLRNSIAHEPEDENTELVGSTIYYAPYVELGHSQEPGRYVPKLGKRLVASWVDAKPFLRPAVENHRQEYQRIIETELKKVGSK